MIENDVKQAEETLRQLPVISAILDLLKQNLPGHLVYHAFAHTEDVLNEAIRFAITDELPAREIELLAIAAAFHDAGFIKSPVANEPIAARMVREALERHTTAHPTCGYSADEISLVEQMILDTSLRETQTGLRQVPTCDLSRYLLDADLSNLGREDFFDKGQPAGHDDAPQRLRHGGHDSHARCVRGNGNSVRRGVRTSPPIGAADSLTRRSNGWGIPAGLPGGGSVVASPGRVDIIRQCFGSARHGARKR